MSTLLPIKEPVIIDESGDVDVFGSVAHAESYLEPIDVEERRYVGYDAEGRLLRLIATPNGVTIESAESEPLHRDGLRAALSGFLLHVGTPEEWLRRASLEELVERSLAHRVRPELTHNLPFIGRLRNFFLRRPK